jgi:hypothetical protein
MQSEVMDLGDKVFKSSPLLSGGVFVQGPRGLSVMYRSTDGPDGGTPC